MMSDSNGASGSGGGGDGAAAIPLVRADSFEEESKVGDRGTLSRNSAFALARLNFSNSNNGGSSSSLSSSSAAAAAAGGKQSQATDNKSSAVPLQGHSIYLFHDQDKIEDFICAICTDVCCDAVETPCTHIFCASCLDAALEVKQECPLDHKVLDVQDVRVAGFVRRKVLSLDVRCPNHASGCEWNGALRDLAAHESTCPFKGVQCDLCLEMLQQRDLEKHKASDCPCREVLCEYCGQKTPFDELSAHQSMRCTEVPTPCPNECGQEALARKDMELHVAKECPNQVVQCSYASRGCTTQVRRSELEVHLQDARHHLEVVEAHFTKEIVKVRAEMNDMVRFLMRVRTLDEFLRLLDDVSLKTPVSHVELIVLGMRIYADNAMVQERGCFALITLCEVNNKNADQNIATVVAMRGIPVIIDAMKRHQNVMKVQEYALHVLRKMATNLDVKNFVQRGNNECIEQILDTMSRNQDNVGVQRDAIGVLLNMAVNDLIEVHIGKLGGIAHILAAMDRYPNSTSLQQLAAHSLFHLTFDAKNKERLISSGALQRLMNALFQHSQHTNTVYYALRAMAQLAKVDRYRNKMRRLGVIDAAKKALQDHPHHKDLQKKCKMLITRLNNDQ